MVPRASATHLFLCYMLQKQGILIHAAEAGRQMLAKCAVLQFNIMVVRLCSAPEIKSPIPTAIAYHKAEKPCLAMS